MSEYFCCNPDIGSLKNKLSVFTTVIYVVNSKFDSGIDLKASMKDLNIWSSMTKL